MIDNLDIAINYASLISDLDASFVAIPALEEKEEYPEDEVRQKEYNSYGFYISNHPASKYQNPNIIKLHNLKNYFDKHIKCVVLIEKIKTIKTKKGDNMAFLTASDETGVTDFVVFPSAYYMLSNLNKGSIIEVDGKVTKRFDNYQINIDYINKKNEE